MKTVEENHPARLLENVHGTYWIIVLRFIVLRIIVLRFNCASFSFSPRNVRKLQLHNSDAHDTTLFILLGQLILNER